ncbi:MAG: acyl-CoA dehydrogenase family protein [Actinobacteria bacterium]|nr:acyl-CoA dehydrogenase family protein [Actinomycetota bacterium]
MDFAPDVQTAGLREEVERFFAERILPAEHIFEEQIAAGDDPWATPPIMEELKAQAREAGLWNLFLPDENGAGLTNLQYAPLCEIMGRSPFLAPEVFNCSAPDTGNMELLSQFGTAEQKERWLAPLLDGRTRSAFSMTEPHVASSDATNIATRIRRDGDEYAIDGIKWFTSGAMSPRCELLIVMGVTDPEADRHRQQSMILVPVDTPGVDVRRSMHVLGYLDGPHGGHAEVVYEDARVPASYILGGEGEGFAIAQARLGPGRIHHAMRAIGVAERALAMMVERVQGRSTFGSPLVDKGVIRQWIADARMEIEQARLLVLKTAWLMDTVGKKGARIEISAIKVVTAELASRVVDHAVQAFGAAGVTQDFILAELTAHARILRIVDGPDEVHRETVARREVAASRDAATTYAVAPR